MEYQARINSDERQEPQSTSCDVYRGDHADLIVFGIKEARVMHANPSVRIVFV